MHRLSRLLVASAVSWLVQATTFAAEPLEITVVTFNVLVEFSSGDGVPAWSDRRDLCIQVLRDSKADFIGLQEPTPRQVKYLLDALPGYEETVFPRYNFTDVVLLARGDRFERTEWGHWWLSKTPDKPLSAGFGNAIPRLLIWGRFKHRPSGRELYVLNTHFDNTMPSQVKMAKLCQERIAPLAAAGIPMIWMGDFNTDQERGDYATLVSNGWKDSYVACDKATPSGRDDNVATFPGNPGKRIDHIFHHGTIEPARWKRIESPDPTRLLSDHYPVQATLRLLDPAPAAR